MNRILKPQAVQPVNKNQDLEIFGDSSSRIRMSSKIPVEISPMGSDPPFIDTEWGALKKAYKMGGHQEFAWIQNGRAQSEP